MSEIWKDVNGFEGRFKVSNHGRILSINGKYKGEKILSPVLQKSTGYFSATLRDCGKFRNVRVHILVCEAFLEKPNIPNVCVNHKDGNKLNNRLDNLEWTSMKGNAEHAKRMGLTDNRGQKSGVSKLKDHQAIEIKYKLSHLTDDQVAELYPISRRHVNDIRRGVYWAHI